MSTIRINFPPNGPRPISVTISQLMLGRPGSTRGVWRGTKHRVGAQMRAVAYRLRRHKAKLPSGADADFAIRIMAKFPGRGWSFFDINGQSTDAANAAQLLPYGNYSVVLSPPAPQITGIQYGAVTATEGGATVDPVGDPEAAAAAAEDAIEASKEMTPVDWAKLAGAAVLGFILGKKL